MAKILLAWELGGGLGHVTVLRPVAEALKHLGHQVLLAARDPCAAEKVFHRTGIPFLQAPFKAGRVAKPFAPQRSFAHLLHHAGFEDADELTALYNAWNGLFDTFEPDITIFDHSPTALLASRSRDMRRVLIGTGFCAPPVGETLPDMRPWLPKNSTELQRDEARTLSIANRALTRNKQRPLARLSELYGSVDKNLLTTFAELDHFGPRPKAEYWGTYHSCPGDTPEWPSGDGRRVFAYLKPTKGLPEAIEALGKSGHSTIIFAPWANAQSRRRFPYVNIRFCSQPLDMQSVANECDFAVLNGTHGTTAEILLAGKPILQLPIYLEQRLVAQRTIEITAGLSANRTRPDEIRHKLQMVANAPEFQSGAAKFAKKYAKYNGEDRFDAMISCIDGLAL